MEVKDPELLKKLKDPRFYLENFCKVKTKTMGLQPFKLKPAQLDIFNVMNKHNRVMILKARQIGFCFDPETKILKEDLSWVTIDKISIGDKIISVDEGVYGGTGSSRKMQTAIVEDKSSVIGSVVSVTFNDGRVLKMTNEHRMLCKCRGAVHTEWRKAVNMRIGDEVRYITNSFADYEKTFEDGWVSGVIDSEGCLRIKKDAGSELTISQVDGYFWDRLVKYFDDNGYNYRIEVDRRKPGTSLKLGSKPVNKIVLNRMDEIFELLGKTRPSRFKDIEWWVGKKLPNNGWAKIVDIQILPQQRMVDLQTSKKTFIAEGFVSHNSTCVTGFIYHDTITNPGTTSALIGYNSSLTSELLDKVKTFWKTTPDELRPTINYNSKYEISFPSIDSKILVLPSTENVGRGYTITNVLATELAFWDKADEKMTSLENSVPEEGKIIIESTPNGMGNLYHRMWFAKDNGYQKKEYGWWWEYSKEQLERIRKRMNNPMKFAQEYELEFLSSGRSVFDQKIIKNQRKNVLKPGDKVKLESGDEFTVREEDGWVVYKPPVPGGLYVCGVDVSEGVEGGDYSVAVIFDRRNGEEVAMFRGLIAPDRLAEKINKMGRKYNNALMVVEINNHGLTTVTVLKQLVYPSLYFRPAKFEHIGSTITDKIGWQTNKKTRPILIDDFAQAVRDDEFIIHSQDLLDEMSVFIYDKNNNMIAQEGFHDDCIFASAICLQGFKVLYDRPLNQMDYMPTSYAF